MSTKQKKQDLNISESDHTLENSPHHIVGLGASAGGLEALESFFSNMFADSGMAFVVVQHLSPDYKSLMVELLSKHTNMQVLRAEEGMTVKPNCIYLIQPQKYLKIFRGNLLMNDPQQKNFGINLPINEQEIIAAIKKVCQLV